VDYQVKVLVEVKDEEVCFPQKTVTADKTINIKYCSTPVVNTGNRILIPNAFSSNADGMNDTWEIFGIAGSTEVIVEIYNRWGELLYYTKNYNEQWNGMYKNQPAPEVTYAYVIRLDNETVLKGTILLIR
jgi:gliding motility-associated-like protein